MAAACVAVCSAGASGREGLVGVQELGAPAASCPALGCSLGRRKVVRILSVRVVELFFFKCVKTVFFHSLVLGNV